MCLHYNEVCLRGETAMEGYVCMSGRIPTTGSLLFQLRAEMCLQQGELLHPADLKSALEPGDC